MPTRIFPGCGCAWTPRSSRRSYFPVGGGCALSWRTPRSYESISARSCERKASTPFSSISHISRAFWRSPRAPSSRKMRRIASQRMTAEETSAGIQMSTGIECATRLIDMYPPRMTLKPISPVSAWTHGLRPMSLMCVCA